MLAAVFKGPNQITVEQVSTPELDSKDILLKVKACAFCGTDVRIIKGEKTRGVRTPSIIGHEISGEVVRTGKKVENYKIGDRLAIAPVLPCRTCHYCKNGKENACLNRKGLGYEFDGGFAEYLKIPGEYLESGNLFKFSQDLSFEEACLAEPLGCVYNGSERSGIKINDTVVIIGAGPIGLMHLMLAKEKGAANIIVSEPIKKRRELADKIGANIIVDPNNDDLENIVLNETDGLGADVVILSLGVHSIVDSSLKLLKKGGTINLFGGFPKDKNKSSSIDPNKIHYDEIWVTGTTACSRSQYENALKLIEKGKIDLTPIISDTFPLEDFEKAYNLAKSNEGIKIIVKP